MWFSRLWGIAAKRPTYVECEFEFEVEEGSDLRLRKSVWFWGLLGKAPTYRFKSNASSSLLVESANASPLLMTEFEFEFEVG